MSSSITVISTISSGCANTHSCPFYQQGSNLILNILIVGPDKLGTEYGGGQVYIRNLILGLMKRRYDICYLYVVFADVLLPRIDSACHSEIKELRLTMPKAWRAIDDTASQSRIVREITSIVSNIKPDIIHAHAWKGITAIAARKAAIPCVITAHHGGIVCPAGALLNADDAICQVAANDSNCLKCCTKSIPGWRFWYPLLKAMPLKLRLWAGGRLRRLPFIFFLTPLGTISTNIRDKMKEVHNIGQNADRIIAPSLAIAEALVRNGIPEEKIRVIPHGIHLPQIRPMRSDLVVGPVRFLFVGRINRVKGLHVMLEAFADLPSEKYELHIVGCAVTKREKYYIKRLKKDFSAVKAVWHGGVPHQEIYDLIASCDVLVHPAIFLEVFGLTIAESLAVGRPVIASSCGGADFQIRDGENGLLVPPNEVVSLRKAIQSMIYDPARIKVMGEHCGDVVSIERHVSELQKVYNELMGDMANISLIDLKEVS